jgi:hypothetical protein
MCSTTHHIDQTSLNSMKKKKEKGKSSKMVGGSNAQCQFPIKYECRDSNKELG